MSRSWYQMLTNSDIYLSDFLQCNMFLSHNASQSNNEINNLLVPTLIP